jgi:hypothetical protein
VNSTKNGKWRAGGGQSPKNGGWLRWALGGQSFQLPFLSSRFITGLAFLSEGLNVVAGSNFAVGECIDPSVQTQTPEDDRL